MHIALRPAHRLARTNYPVRMSSFAFCFLVVVAVFVERGLTASVVVFAVLAFLVYPQLAYLHARVALDSKRAEIRNLAADSFLLGLWIAQLHFALLPSLGALVAINLNNAVCGGIRRLIWGLAYFSVAAVVWSAVQKFQVEPATGPLVTALCLLGIVGYISALGVIFYREKHRSLELEFARTSAERAEADAARANQAKDQFLAVLSHELRTPLTPVLAAVELMQRRPNSSADARGPLEVIRRNVQLQARLIDDLLDVTRIAQGKFELKRKSIDIRTVIERAVEIAKPDIDARRLHFRVDRTDVPRHVYGDASRLQQVVWNLLTNAVKFTPEGGCVTLRCDRENGRVVIEVSDSGIGIEPEAAAKIFDAFEQGGRAITRQFGGLGLGLAIAKRLVEMHEGTISVYSGGRNQGTTFRVSLPVSAAPPEAQQQKSASVADGRSRRILLVEDNGDSAAMMKMLLEGYGFEVETASDVRQALDAIDSASFDLLISDLGLPDRSGIDLMRELRRRGHALKGIALSGYGQQEDMRRTKEAGFSAHLIKPIDAEALLEAIAAIV